MRHISARIEALGPTRFVLFIGLVAGAIEGVPRLLLSGTDSSRARIFPFLLIGTTAVLWWTVVLFLWWIAVRRRQSSVWATAAHVTLGWVIADTLANALSMVAASVDTHGEFAAAVAHQLDNVIVSNLTLTILRSLPWFFGSALAIALGRYLNVGQQPLPASSSPPNHPGAVT
jgi:hypothetical protein